MEVTHYDLFAGIGGFSYALDTVFDQHEIRHIFCEWEVFPTAVLKKHWPDATYYGDVADLVADTECERSKEDDDLTILTGGFPCQPFSHAGRRQGTADDRYKWPEMFAVIQNVQPDWVVAENVRGFASWNDGMVLETVCTDLESEGYEVRPYIIPACAVGAPHRRERVWVVAHRNCQRKRNGSGSIQEADGEVPQRNYHAQLSDPTQQWSQDWQEVALATCYDRVDDGLSRRLDGATLRGKRTDTISAAQHRKERLKACGNAIVPQVAMEIFHSIKQQQEL